MPLERAFQMREAEEHDPLRRSETRFALARALWESIVKFRQPSVWDRYKGYILAAATVLLAQSVLIAGLLLQRSRRRHAEQQVRKSQRLCAQATSASATSAGGS